MSVKFRFPIKLVYFVSNSYSFPIFSPNYSYIFSYISFIYQRQPCICQNGSIRFTNTPNMTQIFHVIVAGPSHITDMLAKGEIPKLPKDCTHDLQVAFYCKGTQIETMRQIFSHLICANEDKLCFMRIQL